MTAQSPAAPVCPRPAGRGQASRRERWFGPWTRSDLLGLRATGQSSRRLKGCRTRGWPGWLAGRLLRGGVLHPPNATSAPAPRRGCRRSRAPAVADSSSFTRRFLYAPADPIQRKHAPWPAPLARARLPGRDWLGATNPETTGLEETRPGEVALGSRHRIAAMLADRNSNKRIPDHEDYFRHVHSPGCSAI